MSVPMHYRTRLHRLWIRSSASVTKPSLLQCTLIQSREGRTLQAATGGGKGEKENNIQSSIQRKTAQQKKQRQRGGIEAATSWPPLPATSAQQYACQAGRGSAIAWIPCCASRAGARASRSQLERLACSRHLSTPNTYRTSQQRRGTSRPAQTQTKEMATEERGMQGTYDCAQHQSEKDV